MPVHKSSPVRSARRFRGLKIGVFAILCHWQSLPIHASVRMPFGPPPWIVDLPELYGFRRIDAFREVPTWRRPSRAGRPCARVRSKVSY
jgi:hypothetical protein